MIKYNNTPYLVSTDGLVFRETSNKPLKQEKLKKGYLRVTLSINGKTERHSVHRLVAETYIPNPHNYPYINHIDNDPSNNNVSNLEWCTQSLNMIHCHSQGRCSNIIASGKAKELNDIYMENKFKSLLGSDYISNSIINGSRYIQFKCYTCKNELSLRSDARIFKQIKHNCSYCKRKMKI